MDYHPYDGTHILTQLQLLFFSAGAFVFLNMLGLYPPELKSVNLDVEWLYRKAIPWMLGGVGAGFAFVDNGVRRAFLMMLSDIGGRFQKAFDEKGVMGGTWSTSVMAFWTAILLGVFLMLYYL